MSSGSSSPPRPVNAANASGGRMLPGDPRLVPALGVVDEPVAQEIETLVASERRALEAIRIDAVRDYLDQVVRDAQERTASDSSWGERQMMRRLRRADVSRRERPSPFRSGTASDSSDAAIRVPLPTVGTRTPPHPTRRHPRAGRGSCPAWQPPHRGVRRERASSDRCRADGLRARVRAKAERRPRASASDDGGG